MERRWEHFVHGADIGIRGIGPTLEAAFEEAALAMVAVIADPATIAARRLVAVGVSAPDPEILLIDWLNALVFEMAERRMLFAAFRVRIENGSLSGEAWGEPVDVGRHQPAVEVKGATMTELRVARTESEDGWIAQCVVDV